MPAKHSFVLALGPVVVELAVHEPLYSQIEKTPWRHFVSHRRPSVHIDILPGPAPDEPAGSLIFDAGKGWKLYADQEGRTEFRFNFGLEKTQISLWLDSPPVRGRFNFPHSANNSFPLQYPVDEILFQTLLAERESVIVHAAGLISKNGGGFLFPGVSGAGKSTLARSILREEGGILLSDDRVALWMDNGIPRICGTPWHGDVPVVNASPTPLSGIFFIEHGCRLPEFRALTRAEAASLLVSRSVPPFWSRWGMAAVLDLAAEVTKACPAAIYRNIPGSDVLTEAERYLENRQA